MILIPYGPGFLQLTPEEYATVLGRGLAPGPIAAPAPPGMAEALVDSRGMAAALGCNDTLVESMARDGRIPSVRVGKLLRFEPSKVLEILRARPGDSESPRAVQAPERAEDFLRRNRRATTLSRGGVGRP